MAKKKKAPASNPNRGFATTSLPSKSKAVSRAPTPTPEPEPEPPSTAASASTWQPPTAEEEAAEALRLLVEVHGVKVRREAARIVSKAETEKRTLRAATGQQCYPLKLDRIFGLAAGTDGEEKETLGDKILKLAREEYSAVQARNQRTGETGEAMLVQAWTLHKAFLGLGFKRNKVEEGIKAVLGRSVKGERDAEVLVDEVLEWMALFCNPDEMPKFLETPASASVKKDLPQIEPANGDNPAPPQTKDSSAAANAQRRPQRSPKSGSSGPAKPSLTSSPASPISNLDISSEAETPDLTDDDEIFDSDEEHTPENLIPLYIRIQTTLYKIHPSVASIITGGKKAKGGGKKPTKVPSKPTPASLSDAKKKRVKKLQQKLVELERDPLFDDYTAGIAWRDERTKLEEADWMEKQSKLLPREVEPEDVSEILKSDGGKTKALAFEDDDSGLMGGLFEGPVTEEATEKGENIAVRDFAEPSNPNETSSFGKKVGKGKAGVGAAALRKMIQEICKSRDVNSKVKFDPVPGTSLSSRCKLTIMWSVPPELEQTVIPSSDEDAPDILIRLSDPCTSIFEMKKLAATTQEQAEGFVITYALFKLYAKKEEKLYLRLPTIWRNVWAELVEIDRVKSEDEERKVLERLKDILKVPPSSLSNGKSKEAAAGTQNGVVVDGVDVVGVEDNADGIKKPKPSYERYLEGELWREQWLIRRESPLFRDMEEKRMQLPMWNFRQEIIDTIEANPVVVLCGETGCGKSTQLPAFLMEHELMNGRVPKIYCTQPRRISALSLAMRVSEEMGEGKNRVGGLVGYAIRLENKVTDATRLIYATTGIVMRMLESSSALEEVTHLVLDEVHERSIESDFLLVVLKRLLLKRKDLKVVLMSATVNAEAFSKYLGDAPILRVPGRTFPVQEYYLEDAIETTGWNAEDDLRSAKKRQQWDDNDAEVDDGGGDRGTLVGNLSGYSPGTRSSLAKMDPYQIPYELIVCLLEKIARAPEYADYSHAILVFLPGIGEIRRLNDMILGHPFFGSHGRFGDGSSGGWLVHILHSTIASEDQERVFDIPPPGMRKIVLATNIAETGVTIPDITAVIDTGKHKEMRFDERRQLSRLVETFVSKANAKQRRGRAGRVQPGVCWHLFTQERFETKMADNQTPEILRLSLQDLVLRVKICGLGNVEEVLTSALDSPTPKNIRRAVDSLVEVKALSATEELTILGRQLAKLPLDVYLGKLVLLGSIFSCIDACVTIAALLSSKSPFLSPPGAQAEAESCRLSFKRSDSDLLTAWNAYSSWRRICLKPTHQTELEFCRRNYLSPRTLSGIEDLKTQLFASLVDAGFLPLSSTDHSLLNRARYTSQYGSRRRTFFTPPETSDLNSSNDAVVAAAIAAAFYPKLLVRQDRGWRSLVGSGKSVRVHNASVNRRAGVDGTVDWLAYYGLMQSRGGAFDAHETTRVEALVVALVCGDAEWRLWPGVLNVDGNRVRFSLKDWRSVMVVKWLRRKIAEVLQRKWRKPEVEEVAGTGVVGEWMQCFWGALDGINKEREREIERQREMSGGSSSVRY